MPGLPRPRPLSLVVTWGKLVLSLATTRSAGSLPTDPFFLSFFLSYLVPSSTSFMFSICAEKLGSNGDARSPVQFLRPLPILDTPGSYPGAIPDPPNQNPPAGLGTTGPLGHPAGTQPTRAAPLGAGQREADRMTRKSGSTSRLLDAPCISLMRLALRLTHSGPGAGGWGKLEGSNERPWDPARGLSQLGY